MYKYPIEVQFGEIDSYGIIHNPEILNYMERARCKFFLDNGFDIRPNASPVGMVVRNITIKIKGQIMMFDNIDLELTTSNIDEYSFDFNYVLRKNGKTVVSAVTQNAYIGLETMSLIPIPEDQIKLLKTIEKQPK